MKITQAALSAVSVSALVSPIAAVDVAAAADSPANAAANQEERSLQSNCWGTSTPDTKWHPNYSAGWANGYCRFIVDCNSPGYSTNLACCKAAYGGQVSNYCLQQLEEPPTASPTGEGGLLDVYYPDYDMPWTEATCINKGPVPSGRPTYDSMLACCKGAYGGQVSGACIAALPNPPTTSPTEEGGGGDIWYPDYDTAWPDATCKNERPVPGGRPTYDDRLTCCKGAYGGQTSGACIGALPNPPTTSPIGEGGLDVYYPDYTSAWSNAYCINDAPIPSGRPTYTSMKACCGGAYAWQVSEACQCKADPCHSCNCKGLGSWYDQSSGVEGSSRRRLNVNCPNLDCTL